jgi:hypothetical protein
MLPKRIVYNGLKFFLGDGHLIVKLIVKRIFEILNITHSRTPDLLTVSRVTWKIKPSKTMFCKISPINSSI